MVWKSGTGILAALLYDAPSSALVARTGTQGESGGVQSTTSTLFDRGLSGLR